MSRIPHNYRGWYSDKRGNIYVHLPNHPNATKMGYVLKHRLICEKVLGRYLKPKEHIHHVNENRFDNSKSNLVMCEDNTYHKALHRRMRAMMVCGNAKWLLCRHCHEYDAPENLNIYTRAEGGVRAWHTECCRIASYNRYHKKIGDGKYVNLRAA